MTRQALQELCRTRALGSVRAYLVRSGLPRPRTTGLWPGGDRHAVSSKFTRSGPRQALPLPFSALHQPGCTCCASPCAPFFRERRAVEPPPHVCAKLYSLVHAFVLYCRSLWVCSRSAEHVVSAVTQTAANKNMRAAAAQSEASFMPAHCSQNHVHCNIDMNSWPLRSGLKGRNSD